MRRRSGGLQSNWRRKLLPVAVASCFSGPAAWANPTGPVVVQGQASIAAQGNTLTVTNTPGTVINWQAFSIAGNEITRFIQQSQSSSVLNRVVGVNPSMILGALQSNGRVFLVNPNGITIGAGAQIDVAGFLASTLNLSDADFLAGRMRFTDGGGAGSVVNHGSIATTAGGMVYLVGRDVQNSGIIRSPQGEILLAAGNSIELVDAQTPELRVQVTAPDNQAVNLGQLIASGGRIGMYGTLLRHAGVASANTAVVGENGRIQFKAVRDLTLDAGSVVSASGPQGGSVTLQAETGTLAASGTIEARGEAGHGGSVQLLGDRVGLLGAARVDVSGSSGGGTVLAGGDYLGRNTDVQNASRAVIESAAVIDASATGSGDGGRVILWSDDYTGFAGTILARGGAQGGNGGFVETSSRNNLQSVGRVDAGAPLGAGGTWLLDPYNLTISNNAATGITGFEASATGANLLASTITTALDGGTSVLVTTGSTGGETGNITVSGTADSGGAVDIHKTAGASATLTLQAAGSIFMNAGSQIRSSGGGGALNITLNARNDNGNATAAGAIRLAGATLISNGGNILMGGGIGAAGNAIGTATNTRGVEITDASVINAGAGSLTIRGEGAATAGPNNIGIDIGSASGATTITADGGISLTGTGGTASANSGNHGVSISAAGTVSLTTNGAGNITINGTGGGTGSAPSSSGVVFGSNATVTTTSTGNISITGQGGGGSGINNSGVEFVNGPVTVQSTSTAGSAGGITINGTGGGTGSNAHGVWFRANGGSNINLTSARGDVSITGTGSATGSGAGILIADQASASSTLISSTGAGAITLTGTGSGGQPGIATSSTGATSHVIGNSTMTGALTLRADTIDLSGTLSILGTGNLSIEPLTASATIGLAGGSGTLNLTTAELGKFQDGFGSIIIGSATGSGAITFGDGAGAGTGHTFSDSLVLRNPSGGGISITDALSTGANNLTLSSGGAISQSAAITAGLLTTVSAGGAVLNAANAAGSFNATNTGSGNIELTNTAAPLSITGISQAGGGDVIISNTGAITLGGATVTGGDLTLTASGTIGQTGAIAADLLTTSSAGGTLLNGANTVGAFKATNTGTGNIELTNTATTLDLQGITQNTGNVVIGNTGAITQSVAGISTAANGGISVTASTNLTISQAVTAGGSGSVTLAGGNVTNTATVTGAGGVTINAGSGTFVNESSSTHQGIVSNGGAATAVSIVADNVDLKTGGSAGNSQINAGTGTATVRAASANRNYDLGSETGGRLSLTAAELDTVTAGGIAIGSTGSEGNINVSAAIAPANASRLELLAGGASGSITQTGTITETDLRLNSAGAITLNAANSVTNVAIGGGNSAVSFNNAGALNIATVNGQVGAGSTGGNLTITATGGDLNINQAVNAGSGQANLATATSGNIVIGANVSGATANLVSAGSITRTAGAVSGTNVVLDSATGIGTDAATRVAVTAGNLAARSRTSGGVFVSETDSVTLQSIDAGAGAVANTAAGGAVYDLTAAGTLTVGTGAVNLAAATGNTVLRTTGGTSNGIVLNADAGNTTGNTTLVSTGSITGSGTAIGASVVLDSATGIGTGTSGRLSVTAASLAARSTAGGGVFLSETDGVTLQDIDPGSGAVSNSAFGSNAYDMTVAGSLTIGSGGVNTATTGNTNLATTGSTTRNIVLGTSNVGNATGNTVLVSSGGITAGTGTVIGSGVALDSSQGVGGSASSRVNTSAMTLAARATAAGGVFVSESNSVTLADVASVANAVTAGNNYDLLTVDGSITLGGNVSAAGNGNVTLAAGTLGAANDILAGAGRIATGSGLVTLSGRGIGVGAGSPLLTDLGTGTIKYTTTGTGALGDVAISNSTAGGFATGQVDAASATDAGSAQVITLTQSAGNITTSTALSTGTDNLSLLATAGSIIDGGATLTANDLRLDGHNAVGASGAAIRVNTAGQFAARLTNNASATGDIVVEEVAAGAGMSVGTANGLSGVATTNNRGINLKANAGNLTIGQAVNAGTGQVDLATATSGNVALGANVGGGAINIVSAGNITRTSGMVSGSDVILDAATGIGGGTGSRVFTAAGNLAARSTTSGGVFVSESEAVTLTTLSGVANGAASGAAYDLTAGGTITVAAAVNAGPATGSTTLATTSGNIALGADAGNASGVTTLTSAGGITQSSGTVTGSGVLLDAADAIGSGGARVSTTAGTLAARTGAGATGGIFITEADNVSLGTVGVVSGVSAGNGGTADVRTTAGDITLAANVSATGSGNVTLIAGGGAGNDLVAGAGVVSTGSGLVTLQGDAVGTTVAPILTDLGSGTLAATSSAGNIAISNSTAGGLNTSQLTGLTTGGGVQTVSIVQSAGNLTVGGSLNVGGDTLVLGASAGDLLGGAGTLTAGALTLNASGLIGGASAVNTNTSGTLTLNSGGSAAAGNITVSEANALPASRVSLGGAGAGSGRSVKLTSVAGPITIDAAIGNASDHLELVTTAGNIAGGAGTISATNLVLNAAAGIGAGTAVNTNTSGNLSLTTAGNGTAGDIALVESNALNTTRVTTLTTSGTGTQSVSLTAPSITLGAAIGNAADNLTLVAGGGTISGSSIVTASDLRLDAHNGIGSAGTPVQINTAGNFAARLTNASATGDIVVEEVAAGAGITVGTANGLSGVATTNNRGITLSAVSGNIVLNQTVNSGSGQLRLTTVTSGNVSLAAGISGGPVDITSAGTIADSAQISGSTLTTSSVGGTILDFGHAVSGFNASNVTGGNIQLVNTAPTLTVTGISQNGGGNVIVNNTGALTIGGAINNTGSGGAINLTGSTGINLNQNLSATDGAVTLNNGTTLGASVQIAAGTGTVTLTGAVGIGSHNLTVSSSGITVLTGGISGSTGNIDIAAATRTDVDGAIALSGAGSVQLDRAVVSGVNVTTTGGGITFDGAASTDTGPVQVASSGGNVLFNDTLTLGSGAGLTVLSGAGTTTFGGAVNGPAGLTVTASGSTIFSSTVGAGTALASLATDGGGVTQLNGGSVATTGTQNYSDAVTLGANTTLTANSITFGSTLNSAGAARTLQINDSGTTTFSGTVGNSLALASLTTNAGGSTAINGGSVATSGAQNYGDAVTLGANTTLTANSITFGSTLNSAGAARTLQINDSGTTTFSGTVGNSLALASLTTNAGGSTAINTTTVNTTGAQTYNDAVTLGADAVLASSGGSDIRFLSTLDGASGLTVNTTGATVFSGAVGGTTPLAFLTTNSGGTTQVNGGAVATTSAQTYNDAVSIGGATTFSATATSAALDFNSTLAAAAHALTLSADEINLAGGAGSVTGTGTVTLQTNNAAAAINIGSAAGATVGALDLAAGDIAALADGFAALQIGRSNGAHAISIGNASFLDPLLVRAPTAGTIGINGALSGTQQITLEAGGAVQGAGSVAAPLVKVVAGGIGSFATPLQINASSIDVLNSAGNAVIRTSGSVTLANNFRNTASGGELRLITQNGAINTAAVAVQSNAGRIALIANDTTGGATGNITVGTGGMNSGGGDIALHAADNITVNGSVAAGTGSMRMIAGTGPGINTSHALFTGSNPAVATEPAQDDFGMIVLNASTSAASMVLLSSTSTATTVVPVITQGAAGSISTTGALTAVSLRGGGAPGNGGGTIDLNDATGNNSTGLINLFACSLDGCPATLSTAPFVNVGTPVAPFTTALYSDGQLFYSDVGGTNVTGVGTSGDFTLYTPGSVTITGPSLSAKNLTIEALNNVNINLQAPFTNNDINGGQPGGSLNFIAGQNVNYTSVTAGATIGTAATPFNHDLKFQAAGNVTVANAIHVGTGNFVVRANQPVSLNNGTVNIAATGTGNVVMQGNHIVSSQGDITVSGVNLTLQGGDTGSLNQASAGQQLLANGNVNLDLTGGVTVTGGTATANSGSAAIIRGAVVNVGSAVTPVASLDMTGGTASVSGTTDRVADALIEGTTALNVRVTGNVGLTGGTATITSTAGSTQKAGASAILKGKTLLFNVAGNVTLTGGTTNAVTGGNTATANAQVIAASAFNPVIQGDLNLVGGDATAQPISGEIANAVASARFESSGDLLLKVSGDIDLKGGQAVAINNAGGSFGEADAGAFVRSGARISIQGSQDFDITGGSATATGSAIRAIASAGVITGNLSTGETLLVNTAGNMRLTGGSGSGAAADAAALLFSGGEAKLTISGSGGLRLEGGSGPFFPPFDTGVFLPNSNLFHMIGDNALVQIPGLAYPITVTGLVTIVPNPAKGAALFVSEAPPLSLDALLAAFIRSTDCVSFSGGACTLSEAAAAGARRGAKDPAGGVCK